MTTTTRTKNNANNTERTLAKVRDLLLDRNPNLSRGDAEVLALRVALGALASGDPGLKVDRDELRAVVSGALDRLDGREIVEATTERWWA